VIVIGALALVLASAAGALVLSSGDKSKPSSAVATTTRTPSTGRPAPIAKSEALAVLDEYAAAYGAESVSRLDAIFSPSFTRRNGSDPAEGRSQALASYAKQFAGLEAPRYSLSLVAFAAGGEGASAVARYSIDTGSGTVTGSIYFGLVRRGDKLLIAKIVTYPSHGTTPAPEPATPATPTEPSSPQQFASTCTIKAWYSGTGFSENYGYIHFKCVDDSSGTTVAEALGSDNFDFRAEQQVAKRTPKRDQLIAQLRGRLEGDGWQEIGSASGGQWYQLRFGR
jgi:hypothetical protein